MLCVTIALGLGAAANAQDFEGCTKAERGQVIASLARAERLALTAATSIGPSPTYTRWFGRYAQKNGEIVRKNLKAIVTVLRNDEIRAICTNNGVGLCAADTFAFVQSDVAFDVNFCPAFFKMATLKQLDPESLFEGNGTRAGTIIHEISHFAIVADTEDICYARSDCSDMAEHAPGDALRNADSYQYFAEDIALLGFEGPAKVVE